MSDLLSMANLTFFKLIILLWELCFLTFSFALTCVNILANWSKKLKRVEITINSEAISSNLVISLLTRYSLHQLCYWSHLYFIFYANVQGSSNEQSDR